MDKDIFPFAGSDGKQRWADPAEVERRLRTCLGEDPRATLARVFGPDVGTALQASERLAFAACHAFRLGPPFDADSGAGVRENVWMAAVRSWVEWMEKNVPAASSLPTCSEPSPAGTPPTPATSSG